jgi:hypothetical protein
MDYDVFISHASEDKVLVAAALAAYLENRGFRVWLDEFELTVGDSLRCSIDHGLSASRFGLVILSPDFLRKAWTNRELDGLVAREDGNQKVILPIWHNLSKEDVLTYSPTLAGKMAVSTEQGLEYVAEQVVRAIARSASNNNDQLRRALLTELRSEELSVLRQQTIVARSEWELEEVLYKVEEFLARYQNHPEARVLQRRITTALASGRLRPAPPPPMASPSPAARLLIFEIILRVLAAGGALFLALRLLGWL